MAQRRETRAPALGAHGGLAPARRVHSLDLDALAARDRVGVHIDEEAARRGLRRENARPALGVPRDLRAHPRRHGALPQRAAQPLELEDRDALGRVHDDVDAVVPDDFAPAEDGDRDLQRSLVTYMDWHSVQIKKQN